MGAVSWEEIKSKTSSDQELQKLSRQVENCFPERRSDLSPETQKYWEVLKDLSIGDGVIMRGNQIVVPKTLQPAIMEVLGAAHQGVVAMQDRARETVYWPGISNDIATAKNNCKVCQECAPSQQRGIPVEPTIPTMPFEAIAPTTSSWPANTTS